MWMSKNNTASGGQPPKEKREMNDKPYLGQRCHVISVGFGTIVDIRNDGWLRVEMDAGVARWYATDTVELLATYPAC
jgi:hypothetical protein